MITPLNQQPVQLAKFLENLGEWEANNPVPETPFQTALAIHKWKIWTDNFSSEDMKQAGILLERHIFAIGYRTGIIKKQEPKQECVDALTTLAENWKKKNYFYTEKKLELHEREPLKELARYDDFAQFLLKTAKLSELFFNFALKNQNCVEPFVEFPFHATLITKCFLHTRLGRAPEKYFYVTENPKDLKVVIDKKPYSLLDRTQRIPFKEWIPTLQQVLDEFANDTTTPSRLEVALGGITSFSCHHFAIWSETKKAFVPIDTLRSQWWKSPEIPCQALAHRNALCAYYKLPLQPGKWLFIIESARTHPCLDIDGSHASVKIWIPDADDNYRMYSFGKYPKVNVRSEEWTSYLTDTRPAVIAYEHNAYTHRQSAIFPHVITEQEGLKIMKRIGEDIHKGRHNNLIVQLGTYTCAQWALDLALTCINIKLPNCFKSHILDSEPVRDPLKTLIYYVKNGPETLKPSLVFSVATLLGWHRGLEIEENGKKVFKCLKNSEFASNGYHVNAPARLHCNIEKGKVKGFLDYGHRPLQAKL